MSIPNVDTLSIPPANKQLSFSPAYRASRDHGFESLTSSKHGTQGSEGPIQLVERIGKETEDSGGLVELKHEDELEYYPH
jgi:hypothetical protein